MTERRYTPLDQSAGHTIWLRDSKRLLFDEKNGLHIINIQTRERHRVLSVAPQTLNTRFSLSPDNQTLYYGLHSSEADIWLMSLK